MKMGELMEIARKNTDFVICTSGSLNRELIDQKFETALGSQSCFLNRNLVLLRFLQLKLNVWFIPL